MILRAERCDSKFGPPRTTRLHLAAASGVRYERRLHKALEALAEKHGLRLEYQPWFRYTTSEGAAFCAPDFILHSPLGKLAPIVIDSKRSFYPAARDKLLSLYLPIIDLALATRSSGLLICQHLSPQSPSSLAALSLAVDHPSAPSIYHWRGTEPLFW